MSLFQPHSPKNSDSIYVSSLDGEGRPYIGRMFWSHSTQVSNDLSNANIRTKKLVFLRQDQLTFLEGMASQPDPSFHTTSNNMGISRMYVRIFGLDFHPLLGHLLGCPRLLLPG